VGPEQLRARVWKAIESRAGQIIEFGEDVFAHPELGFKEFRTSRKAVELLSSAGIPCEQGIAITGFKARLRGRSPGPSVCVLGELDSVLCPGHPHADPQTGAAHSCAHNVELAVMLGVALGLVDSGIMSCLDGDVVLIGVPAEEYVEIEYRCKLRREDKLGFLGGKQQFILERAFEDVDIAMMSHAIFTEEGTARSDRFKVGGTSNGFIGKLVTYRGREAHAGGMPHDGINALNAAILGLMGIHAQRETFRDEDSIRVHPIITKGGDLVNIVPADVRVETYVRGKRMEAIISASRKVDRALRAGADAVGADVRIETLPGYLPRLAAPALEAILRENAESVAGREHVGRGGHSSGSGDMGDVSHLMPVATLMYGGVTGRGHSEDVAIADKRLAYVDTSKVLASTVVDLLSDGAAAARKVIADYRPVYNRESYLRMWEELLA